MCRQLEAIAPSVGAHVGLTGGLLYKDGPRKDLDIIVYRVRQQGQIDRDKLFAAFSPLGIAKVKDFGFVVKATGMGRNIDFLFPDHANASNYPEGAAQAQTPAETVPTTAEIGGSEPASPGCSQPSDQSDPKNQD